MKKWIALFSAACGLIAFVILAASGQIVSPDDRNPKDHAGIREVRYAPDRLLVKYKDAPAGMFAVQAKGQIETRYTLKQLKHFARVGIYLYQAPGSIDEIRKAMKKDPNVAYAEPDYVETIDASIPNDASFNLLWGLHNTGQTGGTSDADIDAPEAWDLTTGNPNVVVAVIDTGVAYSHPDLAANMWTNPGEIAGNGLDDDGNGYIDDVHGINSITETGDPMDDNNHGTHCSGTIAGVGNNGIGVAGVCWTARIMALKFLDSSGSGYDSNAIECIEYAISKGAHILSNSYGSYSYNQAMKDAIDDALAAGILFVAAAGNDYGHDNDGAQPHYPSSYTSDNVIAVASTTSNDALSSFSNVGAHSVDVAAPGSSIYSTITGDSYGSFSGTSMATPHVAGLAALIKSYNFSLDWMQIKNRILGGAEPKAALAGKVLTGGRINAYNSLVMGDVESFQMSVQSLPSTGVPITVTPADLDGASSGSTNFTRRYAPYASVTLTAPETSGGANFGFWTLEGSYYSKTLSISPPLDFNHTAVAFYILPLVDAVDNAALSLVSIGAQGGWMGQSGTYYSGGDAAQSRDTADSGSGTMQTSLIGPGDLTFYWKVSSESGYDYLRFYVDGALQDEISGEVDWQSINCPVADGLHIIQWVYSKDGSVSSGSDCGWVDDVQFSGTAGTPGGGMDQEGLAWTTPEYGGFFAQAASYVYDGDALQSADVLDGETTYLETAVEGPTPLGFYWKVSSESNYDYLRFYIDGVLQNGISGEVDWQQMIYALGSGSHTLRWVYSKDSGLSSGSDCAWLDRIVVTPAGWFTLTLQSGSGGTTTPVPDTYSCPPGQSVTVSAAAYTDYEFSGWTGDVPAGHEQDNPLVLAMTVNRVVTATFAAETGSLTVTAPNGGERWAAGSAHDIRWTQEGLSGQVTIDLYKGGGYQRTLGTPDAEAGSFSWAIPRDETVGTDYRITVWQGAVADQSDADFEIPPPARLVDFSKDGQEDILWRYNGAGGRNRAWFLGSTGTTVLAATAADAGMDIKPDETARERGRGLAKLYAYLHAGAMGTGQAGARSVRDPREAVTPKNWRGVPAAGNKGRRATVVPEMSAVPAYPGVADPRFPTSAAGNATLNAGEGVSIAATGLLGGGDIPAVSDLTWQIVGTGDFNKDGSVDVLWRYNGTGGRVRVWYMNGTSLLSGADLTAVSDLNWQIVGTGDFNRDGNVDILWRYSGAGGKVRVWYMSGTSIIAGADIGAVTDLNWQVAGTGDFNNDGNIDILWRYYGTGGRNRVWYLNGVSIVSGADLMAVSDVNWQIAAVADYDGDRDVDVLWRYNGTGGYVYIWYLNGLSWTGTEKLSAVPDLNWKVVSR